MNELKKNPPRGKVDPTAHECCHECCHYCPRGAHDWYHYIENPEETLDEYRANCPQHQPGTVVLAE